MGLLDRAKKLAEQAKEKAEQAKDLAEQVKGKAEDALAEVRSRADSGQSGPAAPQANGSPSTEARDPRWGTPYVPGMLGRPGWREQGLTDPAAVLPVEDREQAGVPHDTKSQIVEEPFGMGRRWTSGDRAVGVFYRLYPEQASWSPPGGAGGGAAVLDDGRSLVFLSGGGRQVVLETSGLDGDTQAALARSVVEHLT